MYPQNKNQSQSIYSNVLLSAFAFFAAIITTNPPFTEVSRSGNQYWQPLADGASPPANVLFHAKRHEHFAKCHLTSSYESRYTQCPRAENQKASAITAKVGYLFISCYRPITASLTRGSQLNVKLAHVLIFFSGSAGGHTPQDTLLN